ncbi:PHD finger protein 3 isoform X1 [Leucoraja erinacea]|uniref:PHD finger protein 3 isoform X1 n=2 Tax=Leucoraja erinaceus TaxID=7782 RepID=UPI00245842B1|nr:PHD finger protein 3 isoform X1 [Leucoraja erinacea]XP_055491019.1 PHD finger protein 3 isoform X1 [Leucoraja erinacea]
MDIVDIFNPLISTDHLDDILILESNLESEVCDDCGTEPETLGGSLRNMLSDKDPMLGSASAQFSLPFSDTEDSNFQLTCSTDAELELTDEGEMKESSLDTMEEEDLSDLSNKKAKGKSYKSPAQSPRKSPRLLAQEPVRSLRNSTIAKRLSPANVTPTKKKEQVKSVSVGAGSPKLPDRHEKQSPQKCGGKVQSQEQHVSENVQRNAETDHKSADSDPIDSKSPELGSIEQSNEPESTLEITCGSPKCTSVESMEHQAIDPTVESQCSREPQIVLEAEKDPSDTVVEDVNDLHCLEAQVASFSQSSFESALQSQHLAEVTETIQESTAENVSAQNNALCDTHQDEQAMSSVPSLVESVQELQCSAESLGVTNSDGDPAEAVIGDLQNVGDIPCGIIHEAAEKSKELASEGKIVESFEKMDTVETNNEQTSELVEENPVVANTEALATMGDLHPKLEENVQNPVGGELPISSELITPINYVDAQGAQDTQPSNETIPSNASCVIKQNISSVLEMVEDSEDIKSIQLEARVGDSEQPESGILEIKPEQEIVKPVSSNVVAKGANDSQSDDCASDHLANREQDDSTKKQSDPINEIIQDLSEHKDDAEILPVKEGAMESKCQSLKQETSPLNPQHKPEQVDLKPDQTENVLRTNRKKTKSDVPSSETLKQSKSHTSSITSKRKSTDQDEQHIHKAVKSLKTQVAQDAKFKIDHPQKKNFGKPSPISQGAKMQTAVTSQMCKTTSMSPSGNDKQRKVVQVSKHGSNSVLKLSEIPAKQGLHCGHKPVPSGKIFPQQTDNIKERDKGKHADHSNEDERDKMKARKIEKGIPPRQRRSSKSFSLDEPPLFIPDNLPLVKKEETDVDHSNPVVTSDLWDPKKLCGFCRKPHNSRFMVGCGRCDDWFHGECVGLTLGQAQQLEKEDKEYICLKCCAVEDKAPSINHSHIKHIVHNDMEKAKPELVLERSNHLKNEKAPGLKTSMTNAKDLEMKDAKKTNLVNERLIGQLTGTSPAPEHRKDKLLKDLTTTRLGQGEKLPKLELKDKISVKKKGEKGSNTAPSPTSPSTPQPTVEQIRQNVRHSLKDILAKRLSDSDLKVPEERATKVAARIERKLFSFYGDTDTKYKSKYRSLMFNLKDPKNQVLFKRVLKGDIVPDHLIRMSPEELASKELAAWRQRENRHTIEMIEKEQREVERRPITKITHKGEIEIESETPMKEPEVVITEEAEPKAADPKPTVEKLEEIEEEAPIDATEDTTCQHKNHLFDLNCKICTGRMAPPVEELPLPKVKVATSVTRRQSDVDAESAFLADALSSATSILSFDAITEGTTEPVQLSTSSETRSELYDIAEDESKFLARLDSLWKGFINMPSVAKFVTKAYPVSGSSNHLTEDLPDTVQVGGRIPPQMVWDYVDKIKASGTKEISVIRFCPVTEEDQIMYTSLYTYFNSRQRYGVVANNVKQVKDMYLIPLGALEKVPYRLLPFDGPGLEQIRKNLLLGLIIRQRMKRSFSASPSEEVPESEKLPTSLPQEKKSKPEFVEDEVEVEEEEEEEEENQFFNSFTSVLPKFRSKPKQSPPAEPQILQTPPASPAEPIPILSMKPLRFLPGVLVGWENQSTALELSNQPLDDILQSLLGDADRETEAKPVSSTEPELGDVVTDKKYSDMSQPEETTEDQKSDKNASHDLPEENEKADVVDDAKVTEMSKGTGILTTLTLKDKPPDVSTEVFLSSLAALKPQPSKKEEHEKLRHHYKVKKVKIENSKEKNETSSGSETQTVSPKVELAQSEPSTDAEEVDPTHETLASVLKVVNASRDPRQAAVRKQQSGSTINKPPENNAEEQCLENREDKCENESLNTKDPEEVVKKSSKEHQEKIDTKQVPEETIDSQSEQSSKQLQEPTPCITEISPSIAQNISKPVSETESTSSLHKGQTVSNTGMVATHTIETVQSVRRENVPLPPFHGPRTGPRFEFSSKTVPTHNKTQAPAVSTSLPNRGPSDGPVLSGNIFPPPMSQLHNFSQVNRHPSGFPFQRPLPGVNFQPGNLMPSFMSVRGPPLLPPPFSLQNDPRLRFHAPDLRPAHVLGSNHMMPWPPPIPCPPQHHLGLLHLAHGQIMPPFTSECPININRFVPSPGVPRLPSIKEDHRQERHQDDHWDRYSQKSEHNLSKEHGSHHRHRVYSDYHRRKDRHKEREKDKYWDRGSERDRDTYKDRDKGREREKRRSHEDRHRDKDRDRYRDRERNHDGVDSRRDRSKDKDKNRSENEDHDSDKERGKGKSKDKHREKVQEREKDIERDRHHRDKDHDKRDHSDKSKSKKRRISPEATSD